jgi:uncharacterized membrane protein YgaE (UPF0421/DUF939 family)
MYAGLTQTVKTAVAGVVAWLLATHLVGESQAFLAPWSAVLTVHATVYRSVSQGLRQVGAAVAGVLVAFVFGDLIGFGAVTLGLAILLSLLIGRHPRFGNEGVTVATTALVVLITGIGDDSASLGMRLLDTAIGIVVGIATNVLVWPPLQDRAAAQRVASIDSRLGELLSRIATELRAGHTAEQAGQWIDDVDSIDQRIDEAWGFVRQAGESARFNFRRRRVVHREGRPLSDVLRRLEQAVAETRSMAGSLERQARPGTTWSADFATPWINLLWDVGQAVSAADTDSFEVLLWRIDDLSASLKSLDKTDDVRWPVYGALLVNLRNITDSLDRVAEAHPIQLPRDWRPQRPHVH